MFKGNKGINKFVNSLEIFFRNGEIKIFVDKIWEIFLIENLYYNI